MVNQQVPQVQPSLEAPLRYLLTLPPSLVLLRGGTVHLPQQIGWHVPSHLHSPNPQSNQLR